MTIFTWCLIGFYGLALILSLFAPLRKNRKDEGMDDRGIAIASAIVLLIYFYLQL